MITVIQPQEATIFCNATGFPAPDLQWFKQNGTDFIPLVNSSKYLISNSTSEESSQSSLTITETNPFDAAAYLCEASNVVESDTQSSLLTIYGETEGNTTCDA